MEQNWFSGEFYAKSFRMAVSNLEVQCKSFTTFKDGQYLIAAPFDLFLVALFFCS